MFFFSWVPNTRTFRLAIAVVLSLVVFHSIYGIEPVTRLFRGTDATEKYTASDTDPAVASTLKNGGASQLESHLSDPVPAIQYIPKKVWHSAKNHHVSENQRSWINSWTDLNPSHREELLSDDSGAAFVEAYYQHSRPDIVEVYKALPIPILRADLLRYLVILAEGGVWSDLDVTCEKPITDWIPSEYHDRDIDMVVGLEFDFDWRGPGTEVASQFCNWVFAARPSSRNLQVVVNSVIEVLKDVAKSNGVSIAGITLEMLSDVVNITGPKIMTIALLRGLGQLLGREADDRDFSGIKHPKLVGDLLIMPGVAFAAAQNGFPKDQGDILVTHHYEGSWKQADAEAKERKKQKQQP